MQYRIFVVDDEKSIRTGLESALGVDYDVKAFTSAGSSSPISTTCPKPSL